MTTDHFWHLLRTEFFYQSPQKRRFLVERFHSWATLIYYTQLFNIIFLESLTARKSPYEGKIWAKGSLGVLKIVESAGGKFHISGLKALSGHKGPVVYVANHMSLLDTLILPCILLAFSKITFVVKEGLLKYPVLGAIIRAIHPIAVTRENPRQDLKTVFNQGLTLISNGCSIIIFPQATRSAIFDETTFNSLGVKLAKRADVPVVPVALKTDFQGNGKIIKDMGPVDPSKKLYVKFGEPMFVEGKGQVIHQKIVEFISKNLNTWGAQVHSNMP
ncbi:MAG: 1-acyl-sn-glycerol-3-phosphate acyltransferase [Deltaproteobacteria bacterium]|jgi:1-acyl-sn-glycerol-3-phosphate acyltransferase|nr:1-acyl-sn-glycerol-3-phosphate acyltransferase [Deltaproteobacteria bacterium]